MEQKEEEVEEEQELVENVARTALNGYRKN